MIELENVLLIVLKSDENVAWSAGLHDLDLVLDYSSLLDHVLKPEERLLVAEINIHFISMFCPSNVFNLFLLYDFSWHLIVCLK